MTIPETPSVDSLRLTVDQALQQAIKLHQAGRLQAAARIYHAILNAVPNHPDANHNLGVLTVQMKQPAAGLPYFKAALEAKPNQGQYWLSCIDVLIQTGRLDVARKVLAQGRQHGLHGEAVDVLAGRLDGLSTGQIKTLLSLFNQGRYAAGEALAHKLTLRFPQAGFAWKALGAMLKFQGRSAEALEPMQKAIELLPRDAEAHYNLGVALKEQDRLAEAEACLRRALAIKPDYTEVHSNLGVTLQEQGKLKEAEASYRRALEIKPDYAEAHSNLGNSLKGQGRLTEAEVSYRRAREIKPDFAEAHYNLGVALQEQGRLTEAEVSYRRALEIKPDYAEAHYNLGVALQEQGRLTEAEVSYRRALEIKPDYARAHNNLGVTLHEQDRLAEAEDSLRQSLVLLRAQLDGQGLLRPVRSRPVMDLEAARKTLCDARSRLMEAGLPFFLCSGTLLGVVRDGDLLPYDKDMDIGLPWDVDRRHLLAVLCHGEAFHYPTSAYKTEEDRQFNLCLMHRDTHLDLDLFFYRPDGNHYVYGFNYRPQPITSRPRRFDIGTLIWRELSWPVPVPTEQYLTDCYGAEWRVPDPYFDTVLSNRCQTPESRDGRRVFGYLRLFKQLQDRKWDKAMGYCRQLLWLQNDAFIRDLLPWIRQKQEVSDETGGVGHDS